MANHRNKILLLVAGLGLLLLTGCSTISVNYDYDTAANFGKYKTFNWIPEPSGQGGSQSSGLLTNRIKTAVEDELARRGMSKSETGPDLLVIFHLGVQDKLQVTDYGYRYSNYWGYGGRSMDVYQYQEGQMVIDLIDGESTDLVWRGTGKGVVDDTQRSPEDMQARINNVVNQIMANYPPPTK